MNNITLVINNSFSLPIITFFDRLQSYNTDFVKVLEMRVQIDLYSTDFLYENMSEFINDCMVYYEENSINNVAIMQDSKILYQTTSYMSIKNLETRLENEDETEIICEMCFEEHF